MNIPNQYGMRALPRIRLRLVHTLAATALAVGLMAALLGAVAAASGSANLFATVDMNGNLIDGGNVAGVTHIGTGQYEVTFNTNVSGCAYVASTQNAYSQALLISTAGGHLSPDGVYVETKNQGGGLMDGPFNLIVDCGITGMQYAVVDYSGNLARATAGTTISSPGTGRYNITFPASVAGCAYLATLGDPGSGLVFNPNVVETGSGVGSRTVYVETKNLGGGLSSGIPFHLAVICPNAPSSKILVVSANGVPVRGSTLTSSYSAAAGTYEVVTSRALQSTCATVATRGSTNTAVPFDPATVETVPGPAANTIGVQTRSLLFFGGSLTNEAFHSALLC
jgi:hypothetical protein